MPPGRWSAAVGPATANALQHHGLSCHLVPDEYVAEGLADSLEGADVAAAGARVLIPCARTRATCSPRRCASGAPWWTCCPSTTRSPWRSLPSRRSAWKPPTTSRSRRRAPSSGSPLCWTPPPRRAGRAGTPLSERLAGARLCSIGPITSAALRELGLPVAVEAPEYTAAGLVEAVARTPAAPRSTRSTPARAPRRAHDALGVLPREVDGVVELPRAAAERPDLAEVEHAEPTARLRASR